MPLTIIGIIAVIIGPVSAVLITLWHQKRYQKLEAKNRLFLTLMAHRKAFPISPDWVSSLNLIDVVFGDYPKIVSLWHDYYNLLHGDPEKTQQQREHKRLELLSEMSKVLGYKSLSQTDIDKFYFPQGFADQLELNTKVQKEFLRVLENSARFVLDKKNSGLNPLQ
jgi:hypothetical protein